MSPCRCCRDSLNGWTSSGYGVSKTVSFARAPTLLFQGQRNQEDFDARLDDVGQNEASTRGLADAGRDQQNDHVAEDAHRVDEEELPVDLLDEEDVFGSGELLWRKLENTARGMFTKPKNFISCTE